MWDKFNAKQFYNEVAEKYPEEQVVYGTLEGIVRKKFILSKLSTFQGSLLDIGCNVGTYLKEYENGPRIGVDLADKILEKAKANVPQATFYVGSAEQLDFIRTNSIDNVLCTEVLEHIEHHRQAIEEFYRVLNEGGHLLLTTPNIVDDEHDDWITSDVLEEYGMPSQEYYHTAFAPGTLKEMAEQAGFVVLEHGSFCKDVMVPRNVTNKIYSFVCRLNRLNPFHNGEELNKTVLWKSQILFYRLLVTLKLNTFVTSRIPEGLNSYILAKKS